MVGLGTAGLGLVLLSLFLMFGLRAVSAFSKRHIQRYAGDNCLPSLIFGEAATFDGPPKMNNFLFGNALEKVLISLAV